MIQGSPRPLHCRGTVLGLGLDWWARWRRRRGFYDHLTLALFTQAWRQRGGAPALCRLAMFRRDLGRPLPRRWVSPLCDGLAGLRVAERRRALGLLAEAAPWVLPALDAAMVADAAALQPGVAAWAGLPSDALVGLAGGQEVLRARFMDWLRERVRGAQVNGVCVVGNGPSTSAGEWGPEIDHHAVVMRFNRWQRDDGASAAPVGRRIDVWVIAPDTEERPPPGVTWAVMSGPDPRFVQRRWLQAERLAAAGVPLVTVPLCHWRALVPLLQAPPSAGVLVLAWLHAMLGGWQSIRAVGIGGGDGPRGRHRWGAERDLVQGWRAHGLQDLTGVGRR